MTKREQYEIVLIVIFVSIVSVFSFYLPDQVRLGRIVLYCAILLLFQGLLRDLSIYFYLFKSKKADQAQQPKITAQCLCLESGIGVSGVIIGLLLFFFVNDWVVSIVQWQWVGLLMSVLIVGYLIKDWVFYWKSFQFRREPDHANVIFSFKENFRHENNK